MEGEASSQWAIGCEVVLLTTLGEEVQGQVWAYDDTLKCLVLKQPGVTPCSSSLRLLKTEYIKTLVSAKRAAEAQDLHLPYVDVQKCRDREHKAVMAARQEAAKLGVGVSKEAQQIFDALAKTMPCFWDGKTIVVLDEVLIVEPYGLNNCKAKHPEEDAALQRVKLVLQAERLRLGHS